jgi:hypothetical protein
LLAAEILHMHNLLGSNVRNFSEREKEHRKQNDNATLKFGVLRVVFLFAGSIQEAGRRWRNGSV